MRALGVTALIVAAFMQIGCPGPDLLGRFEGDVRTEWLPDGRGMKMLADFAYVSPDRTRWEARTGACVDGASIPQVFWSFIGGPFEGRYRNASIVHDVACEVRERDWRAVHRMFYDACRCGGVSDLKAKVMYAAVYHFGPRWGRNQEVETQLQSDEDYERMQLLLTTEPDLKVSEIEKLSAPVLRKRIPVLPVRPHVEDLALPHLTGALPPGPGSGIRRSGEGDSLVLFVRDDRDRQEAEAQLREMRASAASRIDRRASDIEAQISAEKNPAVRASLASQLLQLSRERAAVSRVGGRVAVGRAAPR